MPCGVLGCRLFSAACHSGQTIRQGAMHHQQQRGERSRCRRQRGRYGIAQHHAVRGVPAHATRAAADASTGRGLARHLHRQRGAADRAAGTVSPRRHRRGPRHGVESVRRRAGRHEDRCSGRTISQAGAGEADVRSSRLRLAVRAAQAQAGVGGAAKPHRRSFRSSSGRSRWPDRRSWRRTGVAGVRYSARGAPICSICPARSTATRSDSTKASWMSCVTRIVVTPSRCCSARISTRSSSRSRASRLDSGSSSSSRLEAAPPGRAPARRAAAARRTALRIARAEVRQPHQVQRIGDPRAQLGARHARASRPKATFLATVSGETARSSGTPCPCRAVFGGTPVRSRRRRRCARHRAPECRRSD